MNKYFTSSGEMLTTSQIDYRIKKSKAVLRQKQLDNRGYSVCETCNKNDCKPVDCAHIISVKEAKETGRAELCWDLKNMVLE